MGLFKVFKFLMTAGAILALPGALWATCPHVNNRNVCSNSFLNSIRNPTEKLECQKYCQSVPRSGTDDVRVYSSDDTGGSIQSKQSTSTGSSSSVGGSASAPKIYTGPSLTDCVDGTLVKRTLEMLYAFNNRCGGKVNVTFIVGNYKGAMTLNPGQIEATGFSGEDVNRKGGVRFVVCPMEYSYPVSAGTSDSWRGGAYDCKR